MTATTEQAGHTHATLTEAIRVAYALDVTLSELLRLTDGFKAGQIQLPPLDQATIGAVEQARAAAFPPGARG